MCRITTSRRQQQSTVRERRNIRKNHRLRPLWTRSTFTFSCCGALPPSPLSWCSRQTAPHADDAGHTYVQQYHDSSILQRWAGFLIGGSYQCKPQTHMPVYLPPETTTRMTCTMHTTRSSRNAPHGNKTRRVVSGPIRQTRGVLAGTVKTFDVQGGASVELGHCFRAWAACLGAQSR